ncbi:MAG: glycosyltransferase family 4 protein [Vampirovibrionales bacterium]|nr:glycosyltransferase family 4 protein [Vampirovibrionales bacterium]
MPEAKNILYIVHDAQVYGSQQSLSLILDRICNASKDEEPIQFHPYISLARSGPLSDRLCTLPGLTLLQHKRLQWFKHDKRSPIDQFLDPLLVLFNAPSRILKIYRHIKKHKIDLVHSNSVVSLEGALAAKIAGVPHFWHIRELFMEDSPKLLPVFGKRLSRFIISALSSRVLCISSVVRQQFNDAQRKNPQKYPLLYNALSPKQIPDTLPEPRFFGSNRLTIGYVGRLSEGKGAHDLLEALALLKSSLTQTQMPQLKIAGDFVDAAYENRIRDLISRHHLAGHVDFLGYQENIQDFYRQIDLLVLPSKNEPFGRVIIEAMAYGVPVIGADSGGIPEIITHQDTGWLYPVGDIPALADLITLLALEASTQKEGELRRIAQKAGRMVRERFTIEQQWRQLRELYKATYQAQ